MAGVPVSQPNWLARARAQAKPDTVQSLNSDLHAVLTTLRKAKGHRAMTVAEIEAACGVALEGYLVLRERLLANPKVLAHPGDQFSYNPVHKIDDKAGLLDLVDSMPEGLRTTDIADSYETVHKDVDDLVQTGEVIAARSTDNRGMVLFPRRGRLVCSLSGTVSVEQGARFVSTSTDLTKEIDRGNVIVINGVACRVVTNTTDKPEGTHVDSKDLASLDTGSGLSASSTVRHQVNRQHYKYEFTDTQLPLERPYPGVSVKDVPAEKFGFTNDVRQLWSGMIADASWPKPGNWPALLDQMRRAQPNYFTLGASPRLLLAPSSDGSMASVFVWDSPPYECGVQTAGNNDLARQSAFCCSASRGP